MKKNIILILLTIFMFIGFSFSFYGCKSTEIAVEGSWQTVKMEIDSVEQEICLSSLEIEKSSKNTYSLSGFAGVNSFFASAKVSSSSFKVSGNSGITKMLGDPQSMEFEKKFMQILLGASSCKIYEENGKNYLVLKNNAKNAQLVFEKR